MFPMQSDEDYQGQNLLERVTKSSNGFIRNNQEGKGRGTSEKKKRSSKLFIVSRFLKFLVCLCANHIKKKEAIMQVDVA